MTILVNIVIKNLFVQTGTSGAEQVGYAVGTLLGTLTFFAILNALILGVIFFIRYIIRKSRKVDNSIPKEKANLSNTSKSNCLNCNIQNSLEARFCSGCGYEISKN